MLLRKSRFTYKTLTVLILGVYKPRRYTSIKMVIFEKILKILVKIITQVQALESACIETS